MDKTIAGSILAITIALGGVIVAGVHGVQSQAGADMHSVSVVDEHGAVYTTTWRD